jgi:hypothetical protein
VNLLGDNIEAVKKNTQTLIYASNEFRLEVNTEERKYMLLSRHQNAGQNYDIKSENRRFENVAHFRYLGKTIINQNLIRKQITRKRRLNSGNTCYNSVQRILPHRLLSKNIKIKIYRSIILLVVHHECQTLSVTL